jgi:hypothetical protein
MKRRLFLTASVSAVVSGCVGSGPSDEDGNRTERNDGNETASVGGVSVVGRDFEVLESGGGTQGDDVSVGFDSERRTVTVEGTVSGRNSCYTAELQDVGYEAESGVLEVEVVTEDTGGENEACMSVITEIEYRLVVEFEGGLPSRTAVVHDGETVVEAENTE